MLRISDRRAIVIGGGSVALRKIKDLLECGALITVIAPRIHEAVHELAALYPDKIEIINRTYKRGDCAGAAVVFSATDDEGVNREVFKEAREHNIFINAVDDPQNCTFFVPSWFNRGGLIVAVSTSGESPALAARIRRDIESMVAESIADTLEALEKTRILLTGDSEFATLTSPQRGSLLTRIVNNDELLRELVQCYSSGSLKSFIKDLLSNAASSGSGLLE